MSESKGLLGESRVASLLSSLKKPEYRLGHSLLFLSDSGSTFEVDHVVLTQRGIFVIETKNYQGVIKGNEYHTHWHQHTDHGEYPFYNPILQNEGHIRRLRGILGSSLPFFSIICFTERCQIEVTSRRVPIIQPLELLKEITCPRKEVLTVDQLADIGGILRSRVLPHRKDQRRHKRAITEWRAVNPPTIWD